MRLLLSLLLAVAMPAAALECKPRDVGGTGGPLVIESNAAGASYGWTCGPGRYYHYWVLWSQMPANGLGLLQEAIAGGTLDAFATKHYVPSPKNAAGQALTPPELGDMPRSVWAKLEAAAAPPAETWKVLRYPFRADGARPVFPVVDGKRSPVSVSGEIAAADSDCNPATTIIEAAVTYMSVRGRQDWVAVCTKR